MVNLKHAAVAIVLALTSAQTYSSDVATCSSESANDVGFTMDELVRALDNPTPLPPSTTKFHGSQHAGFLGEEALLSLHRDRSPNAFQNVCETLAKNKKQYDLPERYVCAAFFKELCDEALGHIKIDYETLRSEDYEAKIQQIVTLSEVVEKYGIMPESWNPLLFPILHRFKAHLSKHYIRRPAAEQKDFMALLAHAY